jgi:3-deoxy-D-manno-octulosonic-acid transferase
VEIVHEPVGMVDASRKPVSLDLLKGKRVVALSSIGNPEAFERTLQKLGATVLPFRFRDHHKYTARDADEIEAIASAAADAIVTTEKDAVRLPQRRWKIPCWMLQVEIRPLRGDRAARP